MPESNAELFRRGAQVFASGDADAAVEMVDEEIEFTPQRAATEGAFHGHDGIRLFLADTMAAFEVFELTYDDVREVSDDRVVALGRIRVRGRGSGIETEAPSAVVASFRDGRMLSFRDYGDPAEALRAVGLADG